MKKQRTNIATFSVIKGGKYPESQVAKYVHYFQDGKMERAGKRYARIQFSITSDVVWNNMWNNLRVRWMRKGKINLKPCNSYCVDPIWLGFIPRSTYQMTMMNDIKKVHHMQSGLALVIKSKRVAKSSSWDEKKKQTNAI